MIVSKAEVGEAETKTVSVSDLAFFCYLSLFNDKKFSPLRIMTVYICATLMMYYHG